MKRFLILVLIVCLSLIVTAFEETIVELKITYNDGTLNTKVIIEAIDDNGEVLLPINLLSSILNFNIDYDRSTGQITLSLENNTSVEFTNNGYNSNELSGKRPVFQDGEIYVHLPILELLLPLEAIYDSSQLLVTFTLLTPPPQINRVDDEPTSSSESQIKPVEAPLKTLTFSSVEYQIKETFRKGVANTEADLYLHLRSGLAEISMGSRFAGTNLLNLKPNSPFFKLKLEQNNTLFLLGNSTINSTTKLGKRAFFGATLITPYPLKLTAYPSMQLEVQGNKDEIVTILINNQPVMNVKIPAQGRILVNVPLKPYRLQEVALKRASDTEITLVDTRNGLKLSPPLSTQIQLYYGLYGKEPYKWQGELFEFRADAALTEKVSLNSTAVWQAPEYKLISPMIKLELLSELLPGYSNKTALYLSSLGEVGGEIDFIFTLPTSHWQLGYFYLPPKVSFYWPKPVGQGVHFFTSVDVSPALYFQADTRAIFKTDTTPMLRSYSALIRYNLKKPQSNFLVGVDNTETYVMVTKDILTENLLKLNYRLKLPKLSFTLKDSIRNLILKNNSWQKQNLDSSLEVVLSPRTLASLEVNLEEINKESLTGTFTGDLNLSFTKQNIYSSLVLDTTLKPSKNTDNWSLSIGTFTTKSNPSLKLELQRNQGNKGNYWLTSGQTFYNWPNNRLSFGIGLKLADEKNLDTSWKLNWKSQFSNGIDLVLNLERLPLIIGATKNEYIASINLSQGLAFTSQGLKGHPYMGQNIAGLICGYVFLDLNGNGQKDPGEPGIKDITVRLGFKTISTKGDGSFVFGGLEPGLYQFGFDAKKLTADYTAPLLGFPVKVKAGDNLVLDLPLTMNGLLEGRVFVDIDGDGKFSNEDELLDWVQVKLLDTNFKTFTDKFGRFYFENLPLGSFRVVVDPKTLPPALNPGEPVTILISPDQLDTFIDLPLKY